jgi:hypothetical protein
MLHFSGREPTTAVFTCGKVCEIFARNAFWELRVSAFIRSISEIVQQISFKISTGKSILVL